MRKKNWKIRAGIILMVLCIPFFLFIPIIPFLEMEAKTKITFSSIALIIGEVLFWVGGILVGKELFIKYRSYLNPKNWFKKAVVSQEIERKNIDKDQIDWDEHAAYWDTFPDGKYYTKNTFDLLSKHIDLDNLTVLDFGCGTGLLTEKMSPKAKQIVAIDISEKMIEGLENKKLNNVVAIVGELSEETIESHKILQDKFDLIVASSVCAFLPNYEEVLTIIKSLLSPQGVFVQWDWLRTEKDDDFGFTEDMIREKYGAAGLNIESVSVPFHLMENDEKMDVLMAIGK